MYANSYIWDHITNLPILRVKNLLRSEYGVYPKDRYWKFTFCELIYSNLRGNLSKLTPTLPIWCETPTFPGRGNE